MMTIVLLLLYVSCESCFGALGTNGANASSPATPATFAPLHLRLSEPRWGINVAPLPLSLPRPSWGANGVYDLPIGTNVEEIPEGVRAPFLTPLGVTNVALKKKVTASVKRPVRGDFSMVTDGEKEALASNMVDLPKGVQWIQIDLERECRIYAIVIWHNFYYLSPIFRGVVVQAADDASFTTHVQTLYNNDYENTVGFGNGSDKQYFETCVGKLIDAKGMKTRYFRFYSNGSNRSPLNGYIEIEVWGLPASSQAGQAPSTSGSTQ